MILCCCSSGASGGANKGPAVVDKRNQVLECPHCDREFKQVQRYREHVAKKHPEEQATDCVSAAEPVPAAAKVCMIAQTGRNVGCICCWYFAVSCPLFGLGHDALGRLKRLSVTQRHRCKVKPT